MICLFIYMYSYLCPLFTFFQLVCLSLSLSTLLRAKFKNQRTNAKNSIVPCVGRVFFFHFSKWKSHFPSFEVVSYVTWHSSWLCLLSTYIPLLKYVPTEQASMDGCPQGANLLHRIHAFQSSLRTSQDRKTYSCSTSEPSPEYLVYHVNCLFNGVIGLFLKIKWGGAVSLYFGVSRYGYHLVYSFYFQNIYLQRAPSLPSDLFSFQWWLSLCLASWILIPGLHGVLLWDCHLALSLSKTHSLWVDTYIYWPLCMIQTLC